MKFSGFFADIILTSGTLTQQDLCTLLLSALKGQLQQTMASWIPSAWSFASSQEFMREETEENGGKDSRSNVYDDYYVIIINCHNDHYH